MYRTPSEWEGGPRAAEGIEGPGRSVWCNVDGTNKSRSIDGFVGPATVGPLRWLRGNGCRSEADPVAKAETGRGRM